LLDFPRDGRRLFVGGRWERLDSVAQIPCISPIDETVLGHIAAARPSDIDTVVAKIEPAVSPWAALSVAQRAEYLLRFAAAMKQHAAELVEIEVLDGGLTTRSAASNVDKCVGWIADYCAYANELTGTTYPSGQGRLTYTRREPYGIVARITPFNHPMNAVVQAMTPSLLAGNVTIVKPPEQCSLSAMALAAIGADIFPAGVFNVVTGYGAEAGAALVRHPAIRRIGFTGSVPTGRRILADGAEAIKTVTVELGGKNPLIVTADADAEFAAQVALKGMNFAHAGQSCMSTSRILIQQDRYDEVTDRLAAKMDALVVGDPRDERTDMGPIAFESHHNRVWSYIEIGIGEGATLRSGGVRPEGPPRGFYVRPTLFTDVKPQMRIASEEIFGPVVVAIRYTDPDEAIRIANDTEFGLNCRVIAGTSEEALAIASRIDTGMCFMNTADRLPFGMPFGGSKQSGLGKENCVEEVRSYTRERSYVLGL
jgi:betaine-aldehyde dehydrogenase